MNITRHGRRLVLALALACLAVPSAASAASVTPTTVTDNPGCASLSSGWSELKVDRVPRNTTYSDGTLSVTISNVTDSKTFDWTSAIGVDAVLVKAGTETYVYSYDPESTGDTNVGSIGQSAISHVSFCYDTGDTPPPPPPTCEEQNPNSPDSDADGKVDACDNCPDASNASQDDSDNDGMGDACEPTPTCAEEHAGEADTDGDGVVDACDNCPSVSNASQADANNNGMADACEATKPPTLTDTPTVTTITATPSGEQAVQQPAAEQPGQIVLGERVAAPTARLIAATGCVGRAVNARVRGTRIASVVFSVDGKRVKTLRKKNLKGTYALRINPAKYRVGVHRLVVKVNFVAGSGVKSRTLRASFQRCARQLVSPRFTG